MSVISVATLAIALAQQGDLWSQTVGQALNQPLWRDYFAYDAGFALLVPLESSFNLDEPVREGQFKAHFDRFLRVNEGELTSNRLSRLQYLYLMSRFVAHAPADGTRDAAANRLYYWLQRYWLIDVAPRYGGGSWHGSKVRLQYKLAHPITSPSYLTAIIDEELYLFAIAADLRTWEQQTDRTHPYSPTVSSILSIARAVFQQRGSFRTSGFVFDPGAWTDHPDYLYAGNFALQAGLSPRPVPDIAADSSHSCRQAAVLRSLCFAYPESSSERTFYSRALSELERQFFGRVLVNPVAWFPSYRTVNFMDGRNGVYRYGYTTVGDRLGYAPYELSGTFTLGWWSLLGTARARAIYVDQASRWPLTPKVITTYLGPGTTRAQYYLFRQPDCFTNGMREIICQLAGR